LQPKLLKSFCANQKLFSPVSETGNLNSILTGAFRQLERRFDNATKIAVQQNFNATVIASVQLKLH